MSDPSAEQSHDHPGGDKVETNWVIVFVASVVLFLVMYGGALYLGHSLAS